MDSLAAPKLQPARRGILHQYTSKLTAFEHTPQGSNESAKNLVIWIGGLFDGLMTCKYPSTISDALINTDWRLAQVLLSSSYAGWGTSSLAQDAKELTACVSYFQGIGKSKIVLMGHSTGCQDVMEYLTGLGHDSRPKISGAIIQAPVSDREAFSMAMDKDLYNASVSTAQSLVSAGKGDEILPKSSTPGFLPAPITASRWLSLTSPNHDGDDDYFSSDLTDEQLKMTFGALPKETKLCILYSGRDEFVPGRINKDGLVGVWMGFVKEGGGSVDEYYSGIVDGASHNLNKDDAVVVNRLVIRVTGFLSGLD